MMTQTTNERCDIITTIGQEYNTIFNDALESLLVQSET